jgi:hypothetical protein
MFSYGYGRPRPLSSRPPHLTAPNGLNLSKSIHNPKSRFRRMMDYLSVKGEATKVDILRDVFGKTIGKNQFEYTSTGWKKVSPDYVTRGWGSYLFTLSVRNGYVKMVRRGNKVFYSVG